MDDETWGDMPAEGSRRFGVFRGYSLERKMRDGSVVKVVFVIVVVAIVVFAIMIPVVKYAYTPTTSFQYSEIASNSSEPTDWLPNELSFGLDFSDNSTQLLKDASDNTSTTSENDESTTSVDKVSKGGLPDVTTSKGDSLHVDLSSVETRNLVRARSGRSKWPDTSAPIVNINAAKLSTTTNLNNDFDKGQTNIFAIPLDISNDEFTKSKQQAPPYVFTPFTSFTNSYAQISPYKNKRNDSNIERVLKYLRENEGSVGDRIADSPINKAHGERTVMKVSGTYIMPLDRRRPGEIIVSELDSSKIDNTLFNGHAYISDPFVNYRPDNPLEINRLIPVKTTGDVGPRFRRPMRFVPKTSVDVDLVPTSDRQEPRAAGSHTVAIFHTPEPKPPLIQKPPSHSSKDKPLSLTLDIFPVTMDAYSDSGPPTLPGRNHGRYNPKFTPKQRDERPRWRPHPTSSPRRPSIGRPTHSPSPENHMIVHLNLYPSKRRKPHTLSRMLERNSTFLDEAALLLSRQNENESVFDLIVNDSRSELEETPKLFGTDWNDGTAHPEFSALTGLRSNETDMSVDIENLIQYIKNSTEVKESIALDGPTNEPFFDGLTTTSDPVLMNLEQTTTAMPDGSLTNESTVMPEESSSSLEELTTSLGNFSADVNITNDHRDNVL